MCACARVCPATVGFVCVGLESMTSWKSRRKTEDGGWEEEWWRGEAEKSLGCQSDRREEEEGKGERERAADEKEDEQRSSIWKRKEVCVCARACVWQTIPNVSVHFRTSLRNHLFSFLCHTDCLNGPCSSNLATHVFVFLSLRGLHIDFSSFSILPSMHLNLNLTTARTFTLKYNDHLTVKLWGKSEVRPKRPHFEGMSSLAYVGGRRKKQQFSLSRALQRQRNKDRRNEKKERRKESESTSRSIFLAGAEDIFTVNWRKNPRSAV